MALRRLTLPIIFTFLLFSLVLARDLEEKPDKKDANVAGAEDAKYPYGPGPYYGRGPYQGPGPYYGHRPPFCRFYCGGRCCSAEEFAAFSQTNAGDFGDDKHYGPYPYGPRSPPFYGRPPHCHYYCGGRCCSAQEYAQFVQAGN